MTYEEYTDITEETAAQAVEGAIAYCREKGISSEGIFDLVHLNLYEASGDPELVAPIEADPAEYGRQVVIEERKHGEEYLGE